MERLEPFQIDSLKKTILRIATDNLEELVKKRKLLLKDEIDKVKEKEDTYKEIINLKSSKDELKESVKLYFKVKELVNDDNYVTISHYITRGDYIKSTLELSLIELDKRFDEKISNTIEYIARDNLDLNRPDRYLNLNNDIKAIISIATYEPAKQIPFKELKKQILETIDYNDYLKPLNK